jgi:hypothetical protein
MKLTSAQVERTLIQFEADALPDSHPMVRQLNELFGDHTFFLDSNGLNIVEPAAEGPLSGAQPARVVNLANWSDATRTKLRAHDPEPTDAAAAGAANVAVTLEIWPHMIMRGMCGTRVWKPQGARLPAQAHSSARICDWS